MEKNLLVFHLSLLKRNDNTLKWCSKLLKGDNMKKSNIYIVLAVIVCLAGILGSTAGGTGNEEIVYACTGKDTLADLDGVSVLFKVFPSEFGTLGLTMAEVQDDTEFELKKNGIKVLSGKELLQHTGYPYLSILVHVITTYDSNDLVYFYTVEFHQKVFLSRKPNVLVIGATTWSSRYIGTNKIDSIREGVKGLVREFINDYLSANPKEQSKDKQKQ